MLIDQVFEEYQRTRQSDMTQQEFTEMLCLVPVLLVAVSDQNVDTVEMGYLTGLVHELALDTSLDETDEAAIERLKNIYLDELGYLIRNMRYWEDKLLNAVHQLIERDEVLQKKVRIRMRAVAESSKGVNTYEADKIQALQDRLGIHFHKQ